MKRKGATSFGKGQKIFGHSILAPDIKKNPLELAFTASGLKPK